MPSLAPDDEPITVINVTPLVDVTLVLVIIFMITMPFLVERALRIRSSDEKVVPVSSVNDPILVELTSRGIRLESQSVSLKDLADDLRKIMKRRGMSSVAVAADSSATHGQVVQILDRVMEAGATNLDLLEPRGKL